MHLSIYLLCAWFQTENEGGGKREAVGAQSSEETGQAQDGKMLRAGNGIGCASTEVSPQLQDRQVGDMLWDILSNQAPKEQGREEVRKV